MKKWIGTTIKNRYGLTLIELLAALAIGTIVIGLAFSVLHTSMNTYKKSESQQLLQQEANLMVTQLRNIHQANSAYSIEFDSVENVYLISLSDGSRQPLGESKYKTEIFIDGQPITTANPVTIDQNRKQYKIFIKIMDPNTSSEFTIKTGISRL